MSREFEEKVLDKFKELDGTNEKILNKLNELDDKVTELDEKVKNMNRSVILIEDKVSNEIPALFDGYSLNHDLEKENEKKIDSLKEENFNNSIRISALETTVDKHSKQIKN